MTGQYDKSFDYETYRRAVWLRVEAEYIHSPMMLEEAADLFTRLGMLTSADGCMARAEYYRRESNERRNRAIL